MSPEPPLPDRAPGDLLGLEGHGDERRLRDGRGEAQTGREQVHPQVAGPRREVRDFPAPEQERRIGELFGHHPPEGEQRALQADEEEHQPDQDAQAAGDEPLDLGDRLAEDGELERHQHRDDRQHVARGREQRVSEVLEQSHQLPSNPKTAMP